MPINQAHDLLLPIVVWLVNEVRALHYLKAFNLADVSVELWELEVVDEFSSQPFPLHSISHHHASRIVLPDQCLQELLICHLGLGSEVKGVAFLVLGVAICRDRIKINTNSLIHAKHLAEIFQG